MTAPSPGVGDQPEGGLELGPAVAATGAEHVAGQALAVHPDEHVLLPGGLAHDEGQVGLVVDDALVGDAAEVAVLGRQASLGRAAHQPLGLAPVADEVGDGHQQEVVAAPRTSRGRGGGPCRGRRR